jgi:arylsulfatase A-like enzyme
MPFMNIVYLHAHDSGAVVQPYGHPVHTPNLMGFAEQAVLFRKAFCISPTCGPSRAALTSGQYPHQIGMYGLPGGQGWLFDDYGKHLVQQLNRWGYETVLAGVQHEAPHSDFSCIGYQRILEKEAPARPQAGECYPETIDKVEAFLATRTDNRPFFLSVGIDEPHRDNIPRPELNLHGEGDRFTKTRYYDPDKLDYRYTAPPVWLPDLPEIRKDMEGYHEGVHIMDEYMGRVLYALSNNGLDDDTLVIVTADHGIEFPGAKTTLRDQGTQIMLMIRGPKNTSFNGGKVIEPMVNHLDIYPTLCELLGKTVDHPLEGRSLIPLVENPDKPLHDEIFSEQTYHGDFEPLRAVRTERYKYIRRHLSEGPRLMCDGPTCPIVEEAGWYRQEIGHEELFDLYLDPLEACNRSADPTYAKIKADLSARLDRWMEQTGDPFATGILPIPPSERIVKKSMMTDCPLPA